MHQTRHLLSQHVLRTWRGAAVFIFFFQRVDLFHAQEGEELQEAIDVSIRGVDPELIELVWAGFLRIQPDCAAFGFTEFGPVRFGDQRNGQAKDLILMQTTGQIDTGGDVAPLIRTTNLQRHTVQLVQAGEVITLQQIIGELGKGDALIVTVQTLLHRFFVDHLVNREVLADITQEGQHVHAAKPVVVVGGDGAVAAAIEVEEWRHLLADLFNPFVDGFTGIKFTLCGFEARVANQAGCTTDQRHRLVAGILKTLQAEQRYQMAQMQAVSSGVKAAIERNWPLRQFLC